MKSLIKSVITLVCVCAVMASLLAVANIITAPIIEKNNNAAANEALLQVMPEGEGFEEIDISKFELPATVAQAYKEANGGYVFRLVTTGYKSNFIIMCGINADGTVSGAICLSSNETLGKEKTFGENFVGKNSDEVDTVDIISGATKTTEAYRNAVKDALNSAIILGGGSVDIRTEEQILADNLSSALPSANGKFTKLFIVETVEGIDKIYGATNETGYVCVVGEEFIGVDNNGNVITETSAENSQNIAAQIAKIKSSTIEKLDISGYTNIHKNVISISKTASGNYVVETKGAGYGIKGDDTYHPISGEYIVVRVSMTKDGKIIDCLTVSQAETDGIGSACADEKFYGQFVGKNESNYTEVDAISGATMTTDGYKNAIKYAFDAVKIIEGGSTDAE
ncbi:MAG: FMN-binding protein [Clostridia bacterium]|nr:FMN-binding protein [Clostridia bacterium]